MWNVYMKLWVRRTGMYAVENERRFEQTLIRLHGSTSMITGFLVTIRVWRAHAELRIWLAEIQVYWGTLCCSTVTNVPLRQQHGLRQAWFHRPQINPNALKPLMTRRSNIKDQCYFWASLKCEIRYYSFLRSKKDSNSSEYASVNVSTLGTAFCLTSHFSLIPFNKMHSIRLGLEYKKGWKQSNHWQHHFINSRLEKHSLVWAQCQDDHGPAQKAGKYEAWLITLVISKLLWIIWTDQVQMANRFLLFCKKHKQQLPCVHQREGNKETQHKLNGLDRTWV